MIGVVVDAVGKVEEPRSSCPRYCLEYAFGAYLRSCATKHNAGDPGHRFRHSTHNAQIVRNYRAARIALRRGRNYNTDQNMKGKSKNSRS